MTNEVTTTLDNSVQTQQAKTEPAYVDVDRVKQEASDKGFNAGYSKAMREITEKGAPASQQQAQFVPNNQQPQMPQQPVMTPEMQTQIAQQAAQELLKHQQVLEGQKALSEVDQELVSKKDKFPDMESVLSQANFKLYPEVIGLLSDRSIPNRAELAYHLASNPSKKLYLNDLAARGDYSAAIQETRKLANSLQQNEVASNMPQTREPLSQLTPSTGNVSSGGPRTISDYSASFKGKF